MRVCSGEKKKIRVIRTPFSKPAINEAHLKRNVLLTARSYSFASTFASFTAFTAFTSFASFAAFAALAPFVHALALAVTTAGVISKEIIWVSRKLGIINIHPHGHVHMIMHHHSSGHVEGAVAIAIAIAIASTVPRTGNIRGAQPKTISDPASATITTGSPCITEKLSVSCNGICVRFSIIVVVSLELSPSAHTACCTSEQNTGYESRRRYLHGRSH